MVKKVKKVNKGSVANNLSRCFDTCVEVTSIDCKLELYCN